MLCALGGEAAPAPAAGLQLRTGLTWLLKSCSVRANSPAGSSSGPEFCSEVCTPVPGIGCTTKALVFAQKYCAGTEVSHRCLFQHMGKSMLPTYCRGVTRGKSFSCPSPSETSESEVLETITPDVPTLCTWSDGPCCLTPVCSCVVKQHVCLVFFLCVCKACAVNGQWRVSTVRV